MAVEKNTKPGNGSDESEQSAGKPVNGEDEILVENESGTDAGGPAEDAAGTATADAAAVQETLDPEALRQEIVQLKQQLEDNTDRMLRNQAEMENLRKRTVRDIENAHKYALDRFVRELLPVLDSMELGISASDNAEGSIESFREGMDLTLKKFLDTLEKFGVTVIEPLSDKFNPEKHEAVSMQELEGAEPGTVVTVMQKGYELNGRLVRPAMVIVAK